MMNAAFRANTSCRQVLASRPRQTLNRGSAETKSLQSRRGNVSSKKLQKTFSLLPSLSRFVGARTRHLRRAHGVLGRHNTGWNGRWVTCSFSRSREYGDSDALGDGLEQVTEKIGGKPVTDLLRKERLFVLETNIDDLSPQVMAYAMEELLSAGGLDVWAVPILMKKGRPGTKINVLSEAKYVDTMIRIILTETSSLGVRLHECERFSVERDTESVGTQWGQPVRVKVGRLGETIANVHAEYEDCAKVARAENVPLKQVFRAALDAYYARHPIRSSDATGTK